MSLSKKEAQLLKRAQRGKLSSASPASKSGTKPTKKKSASEVFERNRATALAKLNISDRQLMSATSISHITKAVGPVRKVLEWMRGSEDERARNFCKYADGLSAHELNAVPIEAICIAADIPPKKFLPLLMEEVSEQAKIASALLSRAAHPEVVATTVASAMFPGKEGAADRKMLHLAEGFVPVPKTQVTFFNRSTIDARTQTVNATLAPVESSVRRISERFLAVPAEVAALPEPEEPEVGE